MFFNKQTLNSIYENTESLKLNSHTQNMSQFATSLSTQDKSEQPAPYSLGPLSKDARINPTLVDTSSQQGVSVNMGIKPLSDATK